MMKSKSNQFKNRKSTYCFNPVELSKDVLISSFEAARWSPSPFNFQPWRFIVFKRGETLFSKLISSMATRNKIWAKNASFLVVICSKNLKRDSRLSTSKSLYSKYDDVIEYSVGMSIGFFLAELSFTGLQAHQMRGFDREAVSNDLSFGEEINPLVILAIGQEISVESDIFNDFDSVMKNRLGVVRVRKPIHDIVYWDYNENTQVK
jgi:nitroreductase